MKNLIIAAFILFAGVQESFAQSDARKAFNTTLEQYYKLKNALAKDDAALATTQAKAFSAHLASAPDQYVETAHKATWDAQAAELKKGSAAIAAEKDIKAQREHFKTISYAMIKLVRTTKLQNKTVYLEHCPMAKASWLNEVEDIQNPYYGSMMYDCGEVKEVIK